MPRFSSLEKRLEKIKPGENPYVAGTEQEENSPVFFGREGHQRLKFFEEKKAVVKSNFLGIVG